MAKVKGVSSVIRGLATFGEKGKKLTAMVVQATTFQIRDEAITNAPSDLGKTRQSIVAIKENEGLRGKVEVGVPYGAFIEFGTGMYVKVPQELQQEALKFKGYKSGSFAEFFEAIKGWCKRHGIDEKAAYPIAMSILKKGIKPRPFLYPAVVKFRKELKPRLSVALDRLVRETNAQK